jgi:hypothetical protein
MPAKSSALTIEERFAVGAPLSLRREFCNWAGICPVTAYREISEGRLRAIKIGRKTMVAPQDATAWRDALRVIPRR